MVGPAPVTRRRKAAVMVITSWAMTMSTIQLFAIAVLAAELIADLGLTRWQIGVLGAMNSGVGAVSAPILGRRIDQLPIRSATTLVVVGAGLGMVLTAAAPSYWLLLVASAVSGLPQGAGNPLTNKVIADLVPRSDQSSVTGVKQSGVQFAVFLAGATLPGAAVTMGWRAAVAGFGLFGIVTAIVLYLRFPRPDGDTGAALAAVPSTSPGAGVGPGSGSVSGSVSAALADVTPDVVPAGPGGSVSADTGHGDSGPGFVTVVAVYAFLLGVTAGGITRFYPLFAHEVLGYAETTAGLAVSLAGLLAIVARLVWARIADSSFGLRASLVVLGLGSAGAALLLVAAPGQRWLLWPAVGLVAFTAAAWNSVAMLAVIRVARPDELARSTGVVLLGFLGGVTVVSPVVGWSVDVLGRYEPAWIVLALTAVAGALVVLRSAPAPAEPPGP